MRRRRRLLLARDAPRRRRVLPAAARSSPTRRRRDRRSRRRPRTARRRRGPAPRRAAARRRPARPADRVVVLHRPPARRRDGGRFGFEFVDLPRRARRVPRLVGVAPRAHRRDGRPLPLRPAPRDRAGRSIARRVDGSGEPTGFDLALAGADPTRPDDRSGGRPGRWPARTAATGSPPTLVGDRGDARPALAGGLGLDLDLAATKPPALHDRDGWIDFGPAGGSYYYSRTAMTATGTLTLGDRTS